MFLSPIFDKVLWNGLSHHHLWRFNPFAAIIFRRHV